MELLTLLIQLASGVAGANIAASRLARLDLGLFGNSLAGILGGALGGVMLNGALLVPRVVASISLDAGTVVSQVAGGGIGGALAFMLIALLKRIFAR